MPQHTDQIARLACTEIRPEVDFQSQLAIGPVHSQGSWVSLGKGKRPYLLEVPFHTFVEELKKSFGGKLFLCQQQGVALCCERHTLLVVGQK